MALSIVTEVTIPADGSDTTGTEIIGANSNRIRLTFRPATGETIEVRPDGSDVWFPLIASEGMQDVRGQNAHYCRSSAGATVTVWSEVIQ